MRFTLMPGRKLFLVRSAQSGRERFVVEAEDERQALERAGFVVQYTATPWDNAFSIVESTEGLALPHFLDGYFALFGMGNNQGH